MLVAYLDEFGHIGEYWPDSTAASKPRPAFGYAGFVLPVENVREFGGFFEFIKEQLLGWEIERAGAHPRRWEKKGASLLTQANYDKYGRDELIPALNRLFKKLYRLGGQVVFYGCEKEHGETPQETSTQRSTHMLINSVRNLAGIAQEKDERIMIFLDAVDTTPRLEAVSALGGFIYKASEDKLRRVVEVPMQLESKHYGNVQFADWVCGLLGRVTDYHLAERANAAWSPGVFDKLIHKPQGAHSSSYVRTGRIDTPRDHLRPAQLAKNTSWATLPPKKVVKPQKTDKLKRTRPQGRGPRGITQSIGQTNPELAAFYKSLSGASQS